MQDRPAIESGGSETIIFSDVGPYGAWQGFWRRLRLWPRCSSRLVLHRDACMIRGAQREVDAARPVHHRPELHAC